MSSIVDSYSESNQVSDTSSVVGQSFTGDGSTLDKAVFYLKKSGSPTGSIVAKIYAHSGTFGSTGVPSGSALATSDSVDPAALSTSFALVDFTFSGANKITLTAATKYFVTFEHSLSFPNYVLIGRDTTSPSHAGNYVFKTASWNYDAANDLCFYVYGTTIAPSASPSVSPSISPSASPSVSPSASPSVPPPPEYGLLRIAKPGINVITNDQVENLVFSSEYGTLKYFTKQSINTSLNAALGEISCRGEYTHGLGYYPFVEVYVSVYIGSPTGIYEYCPFVGSGATVGYNANIKVDTSKITVYGEINGVSSSVWHFDFIVFVYKNNLAF